ncbi:MAG: hypothetical protein WA958_18295 [Tunicatimonas sp.]
MRREILYRALLSRFDDKEAETIVQEVASLEDQNIDRLKEIFATKEDLHRELRVLYSDLSNKFDSKIDGLAASTNSKIDNLAASTNSKIDKIYWFILGQTAIMVGLILAILRTANVF